MFDFHTIIAIIIATGISPLVGLITKWHAPSWLKSALSLGLTTLGAVVPTVVWAVDAPWTDYVGTLAMAWVVNIASHYGFYRPTSASGTGWFQAPNTAAGEAGIGSDSATPLAA